MAHTSPAVIQVLYQHGHEILVIDGEQYVNDIYTIDGELHEEYIAIGDWDMTLAMGWLGY